MRYSPIFIYLFLSNAILANDSLVMSKLLNRIGDLQQKQHGVFPKGSIPSYRLYAFNKDRYKADINPFFTGLIAFTLEDIKSEFSPAQQLQAKIILANSMEVFPKFKNRKYDRNTYNYWATDTPKIFPNAGWLNWFDKQQALPDDLDDTVILLMAQKKADSVAKEVHQLMQAYTNNEKKKINNTFPEYQNIGAYSTWFGKKMPIDFDICVLTNILYFVEFYNLKWTAADSASLYLIENIIETRKHINNANYVSPHYVSLPNILYHLSRLMSLKTIPSLEKLKPQLIQDARKALETATNFMDQVILSTALLRWNAIPPKIILNNADALEELIENEAFCFFIASFASMFPDPLKKWVGNIGVGTFYYYCPAYNNLLVLENLAWCNRRNLRY